MQTLQRLLPICSVNHAQSLTRALRPEAGHLPVMEACRTTARASSVVSIVAGAGMVIGISAGMASPASAGTNPSGSICWNTATLVANACLYESSDDYLIATAICGNILDASKQAECYDEATESRDEARAQCKEQRTARQQLCIALGENAYDPSAYWQASNFVNPLKIGSSVAANPYMPLVVGTKIFESDDETITVTITSNTKLINGVTCVTARDVVAEDGIVVEDTDDWLAQDIYGAVWYCGEIAKNFELYPGDKPAKPELVDVDGSWKAFRDGALPGVLMLANPVVGQTYRQEMALGDAEDAAQVLHTSADGLLPGDVCEEDSAEIAEFVDEQCDADCVVTRDFTPVEPGHEEHKYYARGLGLILEVGGSGSCAVLEEDPD